MKWLVFIQLGWAGIAFAEAGFSRGGKHLSYQTLLMDAEEAVKEDRVEDEAWHAAQANGKKKVGFAENGFSRGGKHLTYQTLLMDAEEAVKENRVEDEAWRGAQTISEKKEEKNANSGRDRPGFQKLLHEAEEAEEEDREADAQWKEEDPEADLNWERAHTLFEKLNSRHPPPKVDAPREHKEQTSHFSKWAKTHPGFQNLLRDAEDEVETEREEIEAEHEAAVEKRDNQEDEAQHQAEEISSHQEQNHDMQQTSIKEDPALHNSAEQEKHLAHELKDEELLVHEKLDHEQDQATETDNPGVRILLKDEKNLINKLKHEQGVVHEEVDHRHHDYPRRNDHPGFQKLLKDQEIAVKGARNKERVTSEFQPQDVTSANTLASKKAGPGFQTLLKGEERWVRDRATDPHHSEFLRHRSKKMEHKQTATSKYLPIDDMPDTGYGYRKVPEFEFGGKGSFWHSMGRRNKGDLDAESRDAQRMEEVAEQEAGSTNEDRDPRDLHEVSRFPGHLVHDIGSMSGWGKANLVRGGLDQAPDDDEDKKAMDMIEQMRAEYCSKRPGGVMNHKDCSKWMFDACKKETSTQGWCDKFKTEVSKYCGKHPDHKYCEGLKDTDGDGILDDIDVFPTDKSEWKDSDGDGVGNNADAFDEDPSKHEGEDAPEEPAAAPAAVGEWPASSNQKAEKVGYPEQGYNEYERGKLAAHNDKETFVGDWLGEWPQMDETHRESVEKACKDHPDSDWCIRQTRVTNANYPGSKGFFDWLFR